MKHGAPAAQLTPRRPPVFVLLAIGAAAIAATHGGAEPTVTDERALLDRGELVVTTEVAPDSDTPFYVARGVIDAPPAVVWALVSDCGRYRDTMARVAASSIVSQDHDTSVCRLEMDMPFPLPKLTAVIRAQHHTEGARHLREWHLVEGDFARHEGSWLVAPFDDAGKRTLVTYRARVRPKLPVPEAMLAGSKKGALADTLAGLRRQLAPSR